MRRRPSPTRAPFPNSTSHPHRPCRRWLGAAQGAHIARSGTPAQRRGRTQISKRRGSSALPVSLMRTRRSHWNRLDGLPLRLAAVSLVLPALEPQHGGYLISFDEVAHLEEGRPVACPRCRCVRVPSAPGDASECLQLWSHCVGPGLVADRRARRCLPCPGSPWRRCHRWR